jgi:hypothetical protein
MGYAEQAEQHRTSKKERFHKVQSDAMLKEAL